MTKRIAFVDSRLSNYQSLVAGLPIGTDVIVLNTHQDGIEQIAAALQGKRGFDAIDIFSHGSSGSISLGSSVLNEGNLANYAELLAGIGSHLTDNGDVLLYGCDVAEGDAGQAFIQQLAQLTGADVAASTDLTGAAALGGDWRLEASNGAIESTVIQVESYAGVLSANSVPSFGYGGDGKLTTNFGPDGDVAYCVTELANGKILLIGNSFNGSNDDIALARYFGNGELDTSFGAGGKLTIAPGIDTFYPWYGVNGNVKVLPDGSFLMGGYSLNIDHHDFALARYNPDGSLDTSFDSDGIVTTGLAGGNGEGISVTVDNNGKILLAGASSDGFSIQDFALVRYNVDGSLDTSFDGDGIVTTDFSGMKAWANSVTIDSNGKILLAGRSQPDTDGSGSDFALARYNPDGLLDTTFNIDGRVTTDTGSILEQAYGVIAQADGKVLVGGSSYAGESSISLGSVYDFTLMRYLGNGYLDPSFGNNGIVITAIASNATFGEVSMAVQTDGKILMGGTSTRPDLATFTLVRYNTDGSLDTTFGGDGIVTTHFGLFSGIGTDWGTTVSVQADGKILFGGTTNKGIQNLDHEFALARFNADGTLDTGFGSALIGALGGEHNYIQFDPAVVLDEDVQIYDPELSLADNFAGASLTLTRRGGANSEDTFSAKIGGTLGELSEGSPLSVDSITIGAVTQNSLGSLVLTFNANATQALVNSVVQQIAYSNNASGLPSDTVIIDWTFSDGNTGVQGTGGALAVTGSTMVNITAVNHAPTDIILDNSNVSENELPGIGIGVLSTVDSDNDPDFTYSLVTGAGDDDNAAFTIVFGDLLQFNLSADYETKPVYHLRVQTTDATGLSFQKALTVNIDNVNEAPQASPVDLGSVNVDTPIAISAATLLVGASDVDGNPLTVTGLTLVNLSQGSLSGDAINGWTFTPTQHFNGTVSFNYTVSDGSLTDSSIASLTVTSNVNEAPQANPVNLGGIDEDNVLTISAATLRTGTSDIDSPTLTISALTLVDPSHGSLNGDAINGWTFFPAPDFNGAVSFNYTVSDGSLTASSTASLTVNAVNDAPRTSFDDIPAQMAYEDAPISFGIPAGLFYDVEGDPLSYQINSLPSWLTFDPSTQTFSGTPSDRDLGLTGISITAYETGNIALTVSNFFRVWVNNVNDAPVASSASLYTDEDVAVFDRRLPAASDADGDTVTYHLRDAPVNGSVSINSDGSYTYIPNANFNGTYIFSFYVSDDNYGVSPDYPVTVTVNSVNDAPEVAGYGIANQTASQGSPFSFSIPLGTFFDVDGGQLSYQATQSNGIPLPSWLGFDVTTRTFTGTPPKLGYAGVLAIQVTATDVEGLSVSDAFNLDIAYVNDAPFAANRLVSTHEGSDYVFTASEFGYADPENQPLDHLFITSLPATGILYLDSNGNHNIDSGEALANDVPVYAADISYLSFKPVIGTSGSPYAFLDFLVNDGVKYSESSYSITINVYSEQDVPGINGAMIGDGNGDGVADNTQSNVESLQSVVRADPFDPLVTWATLAAPAGASISNAHVEAAPANLPAEAKLPFGVYHFDIGGIAPGASKAMSVYLTGNWQNQTNGEWKDLNSNAVINGYWKQDANGVWHNVATYIDIDRGKLRIDFILTDGNLITDADGIANGAIVDPGAPGHFTHHNNTPNFAIGDGKLTTAIGTSNEQANSVTVQGDGKILLGGFSANSAGNDFALVRYNRDGSLDSSFDFDGKLTTDVGTLTDEAFSVTVQADGKILLGGESFNGSTYDFALVRYNPDGSLDNSFDFDGKLTTALGAFDARAFSVAVQTDGKILLGGTVTSGTANAFTLVRYNPDGSLDTGFDIDGKLITSISPSARGLSVSIQTDGKILLGGHALIDGTYNFALARYNPDGSLDSSFNFDGKVTTSIRSSNDFAYSVTLQADGKILLAGGSWNGSNFDFALVRYNPDGSLDTGFGSGGKLITDIGLSNDEAYSVNVQADGKILLGGYSYNGSNYDFALARYNPDGSADTGFGLNGKLTTAIGASTDQAFSVSLQADGKILLSGYSHNGSDNDFAVVRYNPDGSLDTRFDLSNTLDGNPSYIENSAAVVLDSDVQVYDAELAAIDHYAGASLTLVRHGGANADDVFSAKPGGTLAALTQGDDLNLAGTSIGMITTNNNGTLLLTFNSNATQALVNSTLQQIAYSNLSENPPASMQIDWTFSDGNSGIQGAGGALSVTGNTVVNITAINDAPQANPVNLGRVDEDTAITINAATLLAGTSDVDSSNLAISTLTLVGTSQGSLSGNALNGWIFNPAQDFNGVVSFNYTVSDGSLSASSTAGLSVGAINDAPSFGSGGGIVTTNFGYETIGVRTVGTYDVGRSLSLQIDGKILLGGFSSFSLNLFDYGLDFALARYNADGSLDTSFSGDGIITTSDVDTGYSTTVQADGKILLGGYSYNGSNNDFALARYNPDGSLDTGFGSGGKLLTDIGLSSDNAYSVNVQADGKILLAGESSNGSNFDFALVRYNPDGSLDTGFGSGGKLLTDIGLSSDNAYSVNVQADGKILLGGTSRNGTGNDFALVRYNSDGSLDSGFDGDGKLTTDIGAPDDIGFSVALQADGKILLGGVSRNGSYSIPVLLRYNPVGALDTSFSGDGIVTTDIDMSYSMVIVTVQTDGKILLGGTSRNGTGNDFALVRYNSNGSLDTSFSDDGIVTTHFAGGWGDGCSVLVQADGKILLGGSSGSHTTGSDFTLVRYNSDGSLDTSFVNSLNGHSSYTGNGMPVVLDRDMQVFDAELAAIGHYAGASLTLSRHGGANGEDVFSAKSGGTLTALTQGGDLNLAGTIIGTVTTGSNGTLVLTFNANATQVLVNSALQQIAYSNSSANPPALVQIDWTFSDGNSGAQGAGGALATIGSTSVSIYSEQSVPAVTGGVTGDGNGDGVADNTQSNVESLQSVVQADPIDPLVTWATLASPVGASISNIQVETAPDNLPIQAKLPFGVYHFAVGSIAPGTSQLMSVYLTGNWQSQTNGEWKDLNSNAVINGFWKQDANGVWHNVASHIEVDRGKLRIDFTLTDGDPITDADGVANGVIVDPGAPGFFVNAAPSGAPTAVLANGIESLDYLVTAATLLEGWSDADGDTLAVSGLAADHGTMTDIGDGSYTITPDSGYFGLMTLSYSVIDGNGGSALSVLSFILHDAIVGTSGNDTLNGTAGNDILIGGTGDDKLVGYAGDDAYYVDSTLDKVVEAILAGTDEVFSSAANYTLAANIENLSLLANALNGTGNGSANIIAGNSAANSLNGAAGDDTVYGYAGNDTLDGGSGADVLSGGLGDDVYYVDNVGDVVEENAGEGTDLVYSKISHTLAAEVENLTLLLGGNGTGNALNNVITGSTRANILDGLAGADTLIGGDGNDTYIVDDPGDVVIETGIVLSTADVVKSAIDYALGLGSNVEKLTLTGAATVATGNELDNMLTGNNNGNTLNGGDGDDLVKGGTGNDILTGAEGADALKGNGGNDVFIVNITPAGTLEDTITAGAGTDTIQLTFGSAGNYAGLGVTLATGSPIENYDISATAAALLNVTGNGLGNILTGNSAANTLDGLTGNDTLYGGGGNDLLIGGSGNDTLTGGDGADTFWFNKAPDTLANQDVITDFVSGNDKLQFSKAILNGLTTLGQFTAGDQRFYASSDGLAHDASDRLIYNTTTGELNYDNNGNVAGGTQAELLVLVGAPSLADNDIFVV